MKKTLVIFIVAILCILLATLGVSASSNVDNEKYIPKVITTDNGYKMMFDSELARIARRMSSDSYGIAIDSNAQDIANTFKEEGFEDIKQSFLFDEPFMGVFSNNFLVGVKTFEVDGVQKHVLAIAFRGTQVKDVFDYADLFTDASVLGLNGFHSGFYAAALKAYDTLYDMEFPSLKNEDGSNMTFSDYLSHSGVVGSDYSILVTGHSLGGAVANIFAGDIISQFGKSNVMCYTFASPIVCSPIKAKEHDAYNIFNIINTYDIVPKVGYNVVSGVRLGTDFEVTVTDSEDNAHKLSTTYEKATNQVIGSIESLYPYAYRVVNSADEIHIHTDCSLEERRFPGYLSIDTLKIVGKVNVNTGLHVEGTIKHDPFLESKLIINEKIEVGKNWEIPTAGSVEINADVLVGENLLQGGELIIKKAKLEVMGNCVFGNWMPSKNVYMENEESYLLVHGYFQHLTNGSSENLTAGTIEIKGDMYSCNGYKPSGTHKTILSGEKEQQINIDSYNIDCGFNILEITNISNEGVVFIGKNFVKGELYSNSSTKIINGTNLRMIKNATIRGIWNGDLGATNWTCDKECHINGNLLIQNIYESDSTNFNADIKVNGDLEVSSYANTLKVNKGTIEIGGNLINSGKLLMTNDDSNSETNIARIVISGDFKTSFGAVQMSNDNAYILINGNCSGFNVTSNSLSAGTIELKGNMTENCHYYIAGGTHKTILSGEKEQQINLYSYNGTGNFNILEVANTSKEGVTFTGEVGVSADILQPVGANIIGANNVGLQRKVAFVDYGGLNAQINVYNDNAENVIPTWLDYERYCKFALDGDKAFTLNESVRNTSFDCDLYFSNDYNKSSAVVIVAFYDENNRFVQMASKPVDVKAEKIDVSIDFENKPYSTYKIMVWESFDNLQPLMATK